MAISTVSDSDAVSEHIPIRGFDVVKVRAEFPALHQEVHGRSLVYLDSGASAQKPNVVIDAIDDYYKRDHANVHRGVHTLSERATRLHEKARSSLVEFINADSDEEAIFVSGTTEGLNLVAQSYGRANLSSGDEILVSEMEHHSNIVPWQLIAEQTGAIVRMIPMDDDGVLDLDAYAALLKGRPKIVAVTHVANALGTVNPIRELADSAHAAGAIIVVDGAQAVPHRSVDMKALDCDFYAFSGHKMYGPTGIGILYGKRELLEAMPPWKGGGDMIKTVSFEKTTYSDLPFKFEAGTPNIADAIGMGVAAEYMLSLDLEAADAHEKELLNYAESLATQVPGMQLFGQAPDRTSIFSFTLEGIHPHDIGTVLDHQGIAVRTGHHCAQPVMQHFKVPATTRASLAIYNDSNDIDRLFEGIDEVIKMFS